MIYRVAIEMMTVYHFNVRAESEEGAEEIAGQLMIEGAKESFAGGSHDDTSIIEQWENGDSNAPEPDN